MAKKNATSKFEQKRKAILGKVRAYRRRAEYGVFITFVFIFLGFVKNAMVTNDWSEVREFVFVTYRVFDQVTTNIVPLTTIFVITSLSLAYLVHPKFMKFVTVAVMFIAAMLIFVIPSDVSTEYILISRALIIEHHVYLSLVGFLLFLAFLAFKKVRTWAFHTVKYGLEVIFVSMVCYFGLVYDSFSIIEFLKDYYTTLQRGVDYLAAFTDMATLIYVVLVFAIIIISILRAINFHVTRKINARRNHLASQMLSDNELPRIGVCVPAYNEEPTAPKTLDSILACDYPVDKFEILLIADGSTDNTVGVVADRYKMFKLSLADVKPAFNKIKTQEVTAIWQSSIHPNLRMIEKINGGKFDALNVGLQYFSSNVKYISVIDADTTLCEESFRLLATEACKDEDIVALTGAILPRDEHKWYELKKIAFTQWQYFDYLSSFHISRAALSSSNGMMIVSGAYGFFNRYAVLSINGYKESLGEDIYLTLELQKLKNAIIAYIPEAVAYTQVPTTVDMVKKQRMRWFKGLTEALGAFKKMWLENKKMAIAFAEFFVVEWITPLLAPYGFTVILVKPEAIYNPIFQLAIGFSIILPMVQGIIGLIIESSYRSVKWWKLFILPIQVVMSPLVILWRNDGLMDFSSKAWGKMTRS